MVRKKVDNRIRLLIENGVQLGHRSMFVLVGDKGKDQVVILHHMLTKAAVKARPNVLWCYKKELGFSSHRKKRMREVQRKIQTGKVDLKEDDPFELFIASTQIRYCYYSETHKILGNTFGVCVLQDFEAMTPNLLARTVETVEGGGLVIILLRTLNSLKQLYTMSMDVHARFRTEAHQDVVGRFNERFLLSLASCSSCLVLDDSLNILPVSSSSAAICALEPSLTGESARDLELIGLKSSLKETQPVGVLLNCCKTLDQGKALLKFIDALSEKSLTGTVSLTAGRGRGKSAALGLAIAGAIAFGYSNIYVTSPAPQNLKTLFDFVTKGFEVLEYQEHIDYEITESSDPELNKAILRIAFFRDHRQTIEYIHPSESGKVGHAELVVIDEAAAIPLPLVKALFGPSLIFLASTVKGYEGTGRSLSLKLISQLRSQGRCHGQGQGPHSQETTSVSGRKLTEITLEESIRYKDGDGVEAWLNELLCLDATLAPPTSGLSSSLPSPSQCDLYYVNRDTLFCYHKASEAFLHTIISLYVASHYKNSPNDLQMLSDAPAHHLFCLLGPVDPDRKALPQVLALVQVSLEGEISKKSVMEGLTRGKRASGDLIPWTIAQQFQDQDFPSLSGARIVRIATHPDYQGMGYGSRALRLLQDYYEKKMDIEGEGGLGGGVENVEGEDGVGLLEETIEPRKNLPPLLLKLNERRAESLDYLGVSYGITLPLLKFWKRGGFVPVYLRQTANDLTGEHSCIMLKGLEWEGRGERGGAYLKDFWTDFRRRFISLLSFQFSSFAPVLALSLLQNKNQGMDPSALLTLTELRVHVTPFDLKRLDVYTKNLADYHLIVDLLPTLAKLFFLNKLGDTHLSAVQSAILLGMGLQQKTVETLGKELDLPPTQLLGLFNKTIRKILNALNSLLEEDVEQKLKEVPSSLTSSFVPVAQSLGAELEAGAIELRKKQAKELQLLKKADLSEYVIKGTEDSWSRALESSEGKSITIKVGEKRLGMGKDKEGEGSSKKVKSGSGGKSFGKGWKKGKGQKGGKSS